MKAKAGGVGVAAALGIILALTGCGGAFMPQIDLRMPESRMVFVRDGNLYIVDAKGGKPTRLTITEGRMPMRNLRDPAWSPDKWHIAFTAADETTDRGAIYVTGMYGGPATRLSAEGASQDNAPAWKGDSQTILCGRESCLHTLSALATEETNATVQAMDPARPLVKAVSQALTSSGVERMAVEYMLASTHWIAVSGQPDIAGSAPCLSRDGAKLAYINLRRMLCWINLNTGERRENLARGFHPTWSPDGQMLAYLDKERDGAIYTISLNGGTPQLLVEAPCNDPDWSPLLR